MSATLNDWLARLERQHPVAIDMGLERVAVVAERLGLTQGPIAQRVVTVAGTNGKGSTVAMLERLARAHGLSTGSYTSPHLLRYNERLCFDGVAADDATLIAGFERVESARLAGDPVSLTYFEAGTLAALVALAEARPQLAILEVGLGGRLDAVNVIDSDIAVITTIAQDHADFLGTDLDVIGFEKAGILRQGRPAVLGSRALPPSVSRRIDELEIPAYWLGRDFDHEEAGGNEWRWQGRGAEGLRYRLDSLPDPGLPLDNAAVALQVLGLCDVVPQTTGSREAMSSVALAGRLQWLGNWCFDVAHNPHAAHYVAARLAHRSPAPRRRIGLLGVLQDKDAEALIEALSPVIDAWLPVGLAGPRGRSGEALAESITGRGGEVLATASSPAAGVDWLASRLAPDEEVLVCGSFLTVAGALEALTALAGDEV
ncbi:bifunctional folylpolyglutamate synthase/dihydrofolate synthase [Salinicola salarius]|uniref:bifunctional folylpolyglutamate synthase/dihydrofolate synthase n=1 Tax=Salinicola salarius TaxID=430457 RepID=UPI0023E37932|nr:folylpolyglutamate synthase/dihydrofolate synthase family protein [Salinicola salarius]MDF3919405.1 bifunctional folylpolyglutamate synthase/dihydrofolate synthase [Salinicola salarius]